MSDPKDFVAGIDSDQRRSPTRVVFVTRRTSAQVRVTQEDQLQTFPEVLFRAALAIEVLAISLVVFSLFFNAPLEGIADPTHTPNPAKAPWYFLGLQEMLVYFDPWMAGVVMPSLIIGGLIVIPYIDANPLGSGYYTWKQRRFAIGTFCFGFMLLWLLMVVIGTFIRGPGWMWFWPGQTWDPNNQVFEVNRDLPDIFLITSVWGKTIFGAVVMGIYFGLAGGVVHKLITWNDFNKKIYQKMTFLQYMTMQVFLTIMMLLPIKILIRHLFRIKYIWVTPWFNL